MLGYIRTYAPDLRLREHECYRAIYCGLCKSMGTCTGQCSRMSLSYDFVFLAAVRMSLIGEKPNITKKRCIMHPFRKRSIAEPSPTLAYCADASALLSYQKILDDCHDEHGRKKIRSCLLRPFLCRAYRKARKRHPALQETIARHLEQIHIYENDADPSIGAELPAEQFGLLMAAAFSEGLTGSEARIAGSIGNAIGRWIYLLDAADDFSQDLQKGRFNPYRTMFGDSLSDEAREMIRLSLNAHLADAERAFLLIDTFPSAEVREFLANIFYLGLPRAADRVLFPKDDRCDAN